MLSKIGTGELLIILFIAILFIGPNKLPQIAKVMGKGFKDFKGYVQSATEEFKDSSADIREVYTEIDSIKKDITSTIKGAETELKDAITTKKEPVSNTAENLEEVHN